MERPPSYHRNSDDFPEDDPPAYETVVTEPYVPEETPKLILNNCRVYSEVRPERLLYEISNPVCDPGTTPIFGVQKVRYRVMCIDGQQRLRGRLDHIYDFKGNWLSAGERDIIIEPKASRKRIHHDVKMVTVLSVMNYKIPGHFKVERSLKDRVTKGHELEWKDENGKVVAVETRPERGEDDQLITQPQLDIKNKLDEKDLDLLVTCWLARAWKQSQKDLAKGMTWEEFKATGSHQVGRSHGAKIGGFL